MNHIPKPNQSVDAIEQEIIFILKELRIGRPCEAKMMLLQLKRTGSYIEYAITRKEGYERNARLGRLGMGVTSAYKYLRVLRSFDTLRDYYPPEEIVTRNQVFKAAEQLSRSGKAHFQEQLHPVQSDPSEDYLPPIADKAGGKEGISPLEMHSIIDRLRNVQTWIERDGIFPANAETALAEMEKAMPDGFRDYAQKRMAKIRR